MALYTTITADTEHGAAITDLVLSLFLANGRFMRSGDALLRDLGLSSARWQVLCAVTETPRTAAQIARSYELTRQGVLWVIQSMIRDGVVELIDNPDHKRAKLVALTDDGRALLQTVHDRQRKWADMIGSQFTVEHIRQTTASLDAVSDRVAAAYQD